MTILCYGDSNTFGYDPRSYLGSRYDEPWPELLAAMTGWQVRNNGSCGREIPRRAVVFPNNIDLLIVMLGTNDLLQGASAALAAERMEAFLSTLERGKLLLIAPPPMKRGEWVPNGELIEASKELSVCLRALSGKLGIRFLDAGEWNIPLAFDGVHFTEEGHRMFADALADLLLHNDSNPGDNDLRK